MGDYSFLTFLCSGKVAEVIIIPKPGKTSLLYENISKVFAVNTTKTSNSGDIVDSIPSVWFSCQTLNQVYRFNKSTEVMFCVVCGRCPGLWQSLEFRTERQSTTASAKIQSTIEILFVR